MEKEDPSFKRCCFCFPLRYGLLVWGNLKISIAAFFITVISYGLLSTCMMFKMYGTEEMRSRFHRDVAITCVALIFFILDFVVNLIFVIGQCKKNIKLIRLIYYYSIVVWVISILVTVLAISFSIESWLARYLMMRVYVAHILNYFGFFVIIVTQTYFLLLLRSDIMKLDTAIDLKCVMDSTSAKPIKKPEDAVNENDSDSVESEVL